MRRVVIRTIAVIFSLVVILVASLQAQALAQRHGDILKNETVNGLIALAVLVVVAIAALWAGFWFTRRRKSARSR